MTTTTIYTPADLRYAAVSRCPCGAGLAYPRHSVDIHGAWECAAILTGTAIPSGQPGAVQHTDRLPFAFYEVKSEDQPSAHGATTRPQPLTDQEMLERAAKDAYLHVQTLDRSKTTARAKLAEMEAEYEAATAKRNELWTRAFGVDLPGTDA